MRRISDRHLLHDQRANRQPDRYARAFPALCVHNNLAIVIANQLIHDGHSKSRPAARRIERLKQSIFLFAAHAFTGVAECNRHISSRARIERYAELSAVRHRLDRIARKVPEYLPYLIRIALIVHRVSGILFLYDVVRTKLRTVAQQRYGLGQEARQLYHRALDFWWSRVG